MTIRAGVAGWPIAHSLSPVIHGAWIRAAGFDADYAAFGPESDDRFRDLIGQVRLGALRGLNVTAPWKEIALGLADEASDTARACGSANLLWQDKGVLRADSTDGHGLMAALAEQAPALEGMGRVAVVLGAGGAARAAVHALGQVFAEVRIINRTTQRAEALIAAVQPHTPARLVQNHAVTDAALIVNALSVPPELDMTALAPDAVLMDMTYRPLMTGFLRAGAARGHTVVDGLAMLIGQARPSFATLFGLATPDVDVRANALRVLGEQA
ncbi:MAG: shikimate dehydrogenase [Brevundimonas sp.]|uniref:shikimate dehydrogenase family protein n=1 Tax=Brevundimonas sp. TaxID=1871086 RepID=UPI002AB91445|nr:shikimate dehydrogenase [Brevundimonas sp.]MDZ4108674.1 shikimate dehydrogenase [Brevundimonas sp.]